MSEASRKTRITQNPYAKTRATDEETPEGDGETTKAFASVMMKSNPYVKHSLEAATTDENAEKHDMVDDASEDGDESPRHDDGTTNHAPTTASASALVIAASDKAGMEGIDRARIDAIILRESANSLYLKQQRRRDAKVDEKIARLRERLVQHDRDHPHWRATVEASLDRDVIPAILSQRPVRSTCVVVDMDMFYMACELLSRPDLACKPACVGGSMILTSNYTARRYGVRSAMAGWIGDKLVEELSGGRERLIHVPSHFDLYHEKSMQVREVLSEYDPHLRAYSLDEAYMDLGPYLTLKLEKGWEHERICEELKKTNHTSETDPDDEEAAPQDDENDSSNDEKLDNNHYLQILLSFPSSLCLETTGKIVAEMRQKVCEKTGGLTCSAGVAPNFLLAKIGSDRNKPNGQMLVGSGHDSVVAFLYPLPTRKVSGIGRVTEKILNAFSIETVQDLYNERALVRFLFQPASARSLLRASVGCSSSDGKVSEEETAGQKGISRERTFRSGKSWAEINSKLEDIGRLLSSDMQKKNLWARTMTVKVKLHTFDCLSRSRSLPRGQSLLQGADELVAMAAELLREIRNEFKGNQFNVRLLGIRCSNFEDESDTGNQMNIEKFLRPEVARSPRSRSPSPVPMPGRVSTPKIAPASHPPSDDTKSLELHTPNQEITMVHCPVCQRAFPETDNLGLNQHVDACLNGTMVRQAVREESSRGPKHRPGQPTKKQRLTDFFGRGE